MKCNEFRPGFELVLPCSFPTTITITPRAPPGNVIKDTRWGIVGRCHVIVVGGRGISVGTVKLIQIRIREIWEGLRVELFHEIELELGYMKWCLRGNDLWSQNYMEGNCKLWLIQVRPFHSWVKLHVNNRDKKKDCWYLQMEIIDGMVTLLVLIGKRKVHHRFDASPELILGEWLRKNKVVLSFELPVLTLD